MNSKYFIVVFALVAAAAVDCFARPEDDDNHHTVSQEDINKYIAALEKIDIDQILNNSRLMASNMKCFMNDGPCTPQTKDIKKVLPMLINDGCSSCTKEQKSIVKSAMDKIKEHRPEEYKKLSKFYDPEGIFEKKFLENLNKSK